MRLAIPASRLLRLLLWTVAGLLILSLTGTFIYHGLGIQDPFPRFRWLVNFFYVDKEKNLPTWFSAGVLMLAACVLWEIGKAAKACGDRFARHWRILSVILGLLSLDETSQIHEMASRSGIVDLASASYLSWIVIAAPLVIVFALSYLRFLVHLPSRVRWLIVAGGLLFVGGSVGMEIVGAFAGREMLYVQPGIASMKYVLAASVEELMEMLGSITFLYAIAFYLQQHQQAPGIAGRALPTQVAGGPTDTNVDGLAPARSN